MSLHTGGVACGENLDEVKPLLVGDPLRLGGRHDAELLTGGTDQTDLAVSNVLIELMHILANTEAPPLNDLTKQKRALPCRTRTTNAKRPCAFSIIDLLAFAKGGGRRMLPFFFVLRRYDTTISAAVCQR